MTSRGQRGRSAAEWGVFALSCLVLIVVVALIAREIGRDQAPARPVAVVSGAVNRDEHRYSVDVDVANEGDHAAANVQVVAELTIDGDMTEADQTIDFLANGETRQLVFVFAADPADGTLEVAVTAFTKP